MKSAINFFLILLIGGGLLAQNPSNRPQAQITFRVQTDENQPVAGAKVEVATFDHHEPGELFGTDVNATTAGITDGNGMVTLSMPSLNGNFAYGADERGYYRTQGDYYNFKRTEGNKWQPWNPTIDLVLKPIVNPIPMYARQMGELPEALSAPVLNAPVGFDLRAADWVAPYGKGSVGDLIFTVTQSVPFTNANQPFDVTATVSFSNTGDGIQSVRAPINKGSELRLPRYAPQDGYQATLMKEVKRPARGQPIDSGTQEDQNYFFRVRTVVDENGKIKSALYGKIIGDIVVDPFHSKTALIQFSYCLNPNPNDRNMEFDPKKNLFEQLSPLVQVRAP